MLPTQFTPEYYRDSKDIVFADDAEEGQEEKVRPRRSLLAFIAGLFGRARQQGQERVESAQERLAHW
jgi:hypothetical protein